jgi:hypothetical protein
MKIRLIASIALMAVVFSAVLAQVPRAAQSGPAAAAAAGPAPRTADGKPDFSGMWDNPKPASGPMRGPATVFDKSKFPPFKQGGEAFYEPRTGDARHDEPRAYCMPSGFPSAFLGPYPVQIVQNARYLVMITEFMRVSRVIPLDGRPHQTDIEPTYYGDSVGRWEGDTLVIDTTHFKRWSLDDNYYSNSKEYRMHSDAFHTVERLRRIDANTIAYDFTVDDPKIFAASWTENWQFTLHPEWEKTGLYEMICEENNRCPGGKCTK